MTSLTNLRMSKMTYLKEAQVSLLNKATRKVRSLFRGSDLGIKNQPMMHLKIKTLISKTMRLISQINSIQHCKEITSKLRLEQMKIV